MATYTLQGSYSTVQVLSPQLVLPVEYCTISSHPSGVIASYPVSEQDFQGGYAVQVLTDFADGIEYLMTQAHVTAGVGEQTIDASGLLTDSISFTVEYIDPVHAPNGITAQAVVPVSEIVSIPQEQERGSAVSALNYIVDAYNNLKIIAGG